MSNRCHQELHLGIAPCGTRRGHARQENLRFTQAAACGTDRSQGLQRPRPFPDYQCVRQFPACTPVEGSLRQLLQDGLLPMGCERSDSHSGIPFHRVPGQGAPHIAPYAVPALALRNEQGLEAG